MVGAGGRARDQSQKLRLRQDRTARYPFTGATGRKWARGGAGDRRLFSSSAVVGATTAAIVATALRGGVPEPAVLARLPFRGLCGVGDVDLCAGLGDA
jgi:hypothetical protein